MIQEFSAELNTITKRLEWLNAVIAGTEESINSMIKKITDPDANCDGASSAATSRDEACAARAGPCPGFEELKPMSCLREHASKFTGCKTQEELKDVGQAMNSVKKLFTTLVTSCKTSMSDLTFAQDQKKQAREKQKEKEHTKEKERLEKKRAAEKKGGV